MERSEEAGGLPLGNALEIQGALMWLMLPMVATEEGRGPGVLRAGVCRVAAAWNTEQAFTKA